MELPEPANTPDGLLINKISDGIVVVDHDGIVRFANPAAAMLLDRGTHDGRSGAFSMLRVIDNGQGMTQEVKARAFEPFFTTKEAGSGTGLGLSTVYGIVTQSGGQISLSSEPGKGTCVEILLPVTNEVSATEPVLMAGRTDARGNSETILIVEDEHALRELICEIIRRSGYRVLAASNGKEALLQFEKHPDEVDAVITDLVMPVMGGLELVEKLRRMRPGLPVVLMSGYSDRRVECSLLMEFIEKPFHPPALLDLLRNILDSSVEYDNSLRAAS